jgi:ADP-ribose pyrophosphatase YjhB (NUDIX family)
MKLRKAHKRSRIADHLLGATCVAFDSTGRVLISRRRTPQRWELPGGLVDSGERMATAAAREVLEETGVLVEIRGLSAIYHHVERGMLVGVFVAARLSGDPVPTAESSAAEWVAPAEALERLDPLYRPRLADALATGISCVLRSHDAASTIDLLPAVSLVDVGRPTRDPAPA